MTLYVDTSSLVKLYVAESGSDEVRGLVAGARIVATSAIAYAEARAAFARLRRERALRPGEYRGVKQALDADWPRYVAVDVTSDLSRAAGDLAERHALRGYDSVHVASYLRIARDDPDGDVVFSSFDAKLNRAARREARGLSARA